MPLYSVPSACAIVRPAGRRARLTLAACRLLKSSAASNSAAALRTSSGTSFGIAKVAPPPDCASAASLNAVCKEQCIENALKPGFVGKAHVTCLLQPSTEASLARPVLWLASWSRPDAHKIEDLENS